MPAPIIAAAAIGAAGSVAAANSAKGAAADASDAQSYAAQQARAEQNRRFEEAKELLSPYVDAGNTAQSAQSDLIGLSGMEAQQSAISGIEQGVEFGSLTQQGEAAILANAAATGGLRGGNTQAALAQYRPQVLSSLINQQYDRLGGISDRGLNAASSTAQAAVSTGQGVANTYQQEGAAQAGASLAEGQAMAGLYSSLGSIAGGLLGSTDGGNNIGDSALFDSAFGGKGLGLF